ncbi:transmembrane protein fates-shifted [Anticarsia gemmatalis]|uniref:transmembrane protein fates-shifted n=1 Tax=Anticarsia gemmatalis TaxID=129554 RepID=UPI003F75C223
MSKKKGKKNVIQDFTINDCANAMKPVKTIRKSATEATEPSWDEINDDGDIIEETASDGTKKFVYKKKQSDPPIDQRPGIEYPEIIWYLISKYIRPEDIGTFARINKATYCVTKNKSFWLLLYKRHCENNPKLPEKLRSDSFKAYGLRQTVIRALFHTYDVFVKRLARQATQDSRPHLLVNRKCVNVWFCKGLTYWSVYFKLKKPQLERQEVLDFIEELGRIDANPEEDTQVLQVTCKSFQEVPPLMGMTLSSVTMTLAQGFRHHRLTLGFNSSPYTTKGVLPECSVVLDAVVAALVCDWWHPSYPHGGVLVPRQDPPLLKRNFFDEDCS